jgi:hypothetical protein
VAQKWNFEPLVKGRMPCQGNLLLKMLCLFVASIFRAGEITLRRIPKFSFVRVNLRRVKIDGFTNNAYHFKA